MSATGHMSSRRSAAGRAVVACSLLGAAALLAGPLSDDATGGPSVDRVRYQVTASYVAEYSRTWASPQDPKITERVQAKTVWKASSSVVWLSAPPGAAKAVVRLRVGGGKLTGPVVRHTGAGVGDETGARAGDATITDCVKPYRLEASKRAGASLRLLLSPKRSDYVLVVSISPTPGSTSVTKVGAATCTVVSDDGQTVRLSYPASSHTCDPCLGIWAGAYALPVSRKKIRFGQPFTLDYRADPVSAPSLSRQIPGGEEFVFFRLTFHFKPLRRYFGD